MCKLKTLLFHCLWFLVCVLKFVVKTDANIVRFIESYYSRKGVNQLVLFSCWTNDEKVKNSRELMKFGIRFSYVPVSDDLNMKNILKANYYKLGVFLDLNCYQSNVILQQFTEQQLSFNESYFWLIITDETKLPVNLFYVLPLSINCEVTVATRQNDYYHLYDVYNPSYRHGGNLNVTFMGYWNAREGLRITLTLYKYKRRGNLYGLPLNFSIVINYPPKHMDIATYLIKPIDKHYDTMHRYNYALTLQLRDFYNFTINLLRGSTWGYLVNGSFNGILGDMIKGIVDIGVSPFQFKRERIDILEYTVESWVVRPAIIFRHPKKNVLSNNFLKPFHKKTWYVTFVLAVINWLLLYISVKTYKCYSKKRPTDMLDTNPASETFLIVTAAVCQQGQSEGPRVYSGRIVFISLFLWGLMLYQFYSASIVGSLLAEPARFINTVRDLADSNIEVGIEDIAYNYDLFRTTTDPELIYLYNKKIALNKKRKKLPFFAPEVGLQKVQKGNFGFHVDTATAYKIIEETFTEEEICDLAEIQLVSPKITATGTSKHSPFKKMVTYGLRHVVERGMANRLRHVWLHRRPKCPESHSSQPTPIQIMEFFPAISLLLMGSSFALLVLLVEHLFRQYQWHKMKNTSNTDETM